MCARHEEGRGECSKNDCHMGWVSKKELGEGEVSFLDIQV